MRFALAARLLSAVLITALAGSTRAQEAATQPARARLLSFSDSRLIASPASSLLALNTTKSRLCTAPSAAQQPDLATALATARSLVGAAGEQAATSVTASAEGKDAAAALATAGAAVVSANPLAALAALLAAHDADPKDAPALVNAAAILNSFGYPAEAAALVAASGVLDTAAEAVSNPATRAVALNNRGHALLALGRYAEAEASLRQALTLLPDLAEASTNLAGALLCQDKPEAAAEALAKGRVRAAPDATFISQCSGTPCDPSRATRREAAASAFRLQAGKEIPLPALTLPATWQEGNALQPTLAKLASSLAGPTRTASNARLQVARDKLNARVTSGQAPIPVSRVRFQDQLDLIYAARLDPSVSDLRAKADAAREALLKLQTDLVSRLGAPAGEAANCTVAQAPARQALESAFPQWRELASTYNSAERAYWAAASKLMTSLAAGLKDPLHREFALASIEASEIATISELVQPLSAWLEAAGRITACPGDSGNAPDLSLPVTPVEAGTCPLLDANLTYGLTVAPFLSLSIACELVTSERATPAWFAPFASVGYLQGKRVDPIQARAHNDGELTVLLGDWVGFGDTAGRRYLVRVNGAGDITDIGASLAPATPPAAAQTPQGMLIASVYRAN